MSIRHPIILSHNSAPGSHRRQKRAVETSGVLPARQLNVSYGTLPVLAPDDRTIFSLRGDILAKYVSIAYVYLRGYFELEEIGEQIMYLTIGNK